MSTGTLEMLLLHTPKQHLLQPPSTQIETKIISTVLIISNDSTFCLSRPPDTLPQTTKDYRLL